MKHYNIDSLLPVYNLLANEIEKILLKVHFIIFIQLII